MEEYDAERVAALCGIAAAVLSLSAVYGSTIISGMAGNFTWRGASLSSMGREVEPTFLLFNGGLILGAVLAMPFTWGLWQAAENHVQRAGTLVFGYAALGMGGVGIAYLEGPLAAYHFGAAVSFFFGGTIAMWLYGGGLVLAGDRNWGVASVGMGVTHIVAWVVWGATTTGGTDGAWFAVTEAIGATLIGAWVAYQGWRLVPDDATVPGLG